MDFSGPETNSEILEMVGASEFRLGSTNSG